MSSFRTANPLLTESAFETQSAGRGYGNMAAADASRFMTLQGTVNASLILMGLCIASAVAAWSLLQSPSGGFHPLLMPVFFGGMIGAAVLAIVCHFKPSAAPYIGWLIAICQGLFAGGASIFWSAYAERSKSGVVGQLGTGLVLQASMLTAGIAISLLIAYKTRLIRATENFRLAVAAATGGIAIVSLASLVLGLFGVRIPYLWDNGIIGIGFAGFIVVTAALNLVLDFDFIERGSANQLPKHMEWYAGIGLLVTLVWLYVSILRLLAMLQSRR